jgi:hypothetical protein
MKNGNYSQRKIRQHECTSVVFDGPTSANGRCRIHADTAEERRAFYHGKESR